MSTQKVEGCMEPSPEPDSDVWRLFLYAMESPVTRDKYQRRLSEFFEFAGVKGELAKAWIGQEAIVTQEKESRAKVKSDSLKTGCLIN